MKARTALPVRDFLASALRERMMIYGLKGKAQNGGLYMRGENAIIFSLMTV